MTSKSKLDNAERALSQFAEFCQVQNPSKLEIAGTIQGFEFTLEVLWKLFKSLAEDKGYQIDSPRAALSAALKMGLIGNEQTWVKMLKDRNETSHIYNEIVAQGIYERSTKEYLKEFQVAIGRVKAI